jgi:SAM-dependent methyltransferase
MSQPDHPAPSPPADRLTRFSDRARDYARWRPTYPSEAIDAILDGLGDPARLSAADIGAGTGISARLLAERGVRVEAVEPNDAMRATGQSHPHPRITWRKGAGEATGLPDAGVGLVLYAQAFHWVQREPALAEAARILSRPGRLALLWNVHDEADPFTRAYREIIRRHATDDPTSPSFTGDTHIPFPHAPGWRGYRRLEFESEQRLDLGGLLGRATSSSYCPREGEAGEALRTALTALFERWQKSGEVAIRYRCAAHLAEASTP